MRKRHKSAMGENMSDDTTPGTSGDAHDHEGQGSSDTLVMSGDHKASIDQNVAGQKSCVAAAAAAAGDDEEDNSSDACDNPVTPESPDDLENLGGQTMDHLTSAGGQSREEDHTKCHVPPPKRQRLLSDASKPTDQDKNYAGLTDYLSNLSLEVICQILEYLPIWDILKLESQCRHLQEAVKLHLRLITDLDFTEGEIHGWMPTRFTDSTFEKFMRRCPELMYVYGLHFHQLNRRRQRGFDILSVPGMIETLQQMPHLQGIETSNIFLLEAVLNYLPDVEIMGIFKNRDGAFPIPTHNAISLTKGAQLTSLHLIGVELRDLPRMDFLKKLHLKWVRFTNQNPFKDFTMPCLRTFVINNCAGPQNALKYVPLMTGLVTARNLSRLELVRVPFLGGLIHHVVEDSWRVSGFRNLHRIMLGACKHAQEADLGYLIVTCCAKLEELYIQPSLTKDSFFYSLTHAEVDFPSLSTLHLGFVDSFPEHGKWSQSDLVNHGLAEYAESPAFLTDFGMKCVQEVFTALTSLSLYNCPHLHLPTCWLSPDDLVGFNHVTDLCLCRCHAIRLEDFCHFIKSLPCLETLTLEQMFREPPKGCSRVGLSAGTGLGVSSALVSDNGHEPPANQNPNNNPAANQQQHNNPAGHNNEIGLGDAGNQNQNMAAHDDEDHEDSEGDMDEEDEDLDDEEDYEIDVEIDLAENDDRVESTMDVSSGTGEPSGTVEGSQELNHGLDIHSPEGAGEAMTSKSSQNDPSDAGEKCDGASSEQTSNCDGDDREETDKSGNENLPSTNDSKIRELLLQDVIDDDDSVDMVPGSGCVEVDGLVWDEEIVEVISGKAAANQSGSLKSDWNLPDSGAGPSRVCQNTDDGCAQAAHVSPKSVEPSGTGDHAYTETPGGESEDEQMSCARVDSSGTFNKSKGKRPINRQIPGKPKGKSLWGAKKGIVKKSGQSSSPVRVSRSCQASSEDIRECTKHAGLSNQTMSSKDSEKGCGGTPVVTTSVRKPSGAGPVNADPLPEVHNQPSRKPARASKNRKSGHRAPKPAMHDQGTSTSDPVIEEDHVQVLSVDCKMLVNISLHHVGITDLVIKECPKLHSLTGFACRVLKNVTIKKATKLGRISFAQCPKLLHEDLVDEICSQPPEKYRLIFLRPVKPYSSEGLKRQLFGTKSYKYQMCLIHDFSVNPEDSMYNRLRVSVWPDVITNVNFDLIKKGCVKDAAHAATIEGDYPWRQGTYTMQGMDRGDSSRCSWSLVSDIPWIQSLAADSDRNNHNRMSSDSRDGIYSPSAKGHTNVRQAMDVLQPDIQRVTDSGISLYLHPVIVYVNVCDINGVTPDMYV